LPGAGWDRTTKARFSGKAADGKLSLTGAKDKFLVADGASRRHAFAAYGAALDEEAAAAGALADLSASDMPEAA